MNIILLERKLVMKMLLLCFVLFQFVLVVGDSHLRGFVDGIVEFPEGPVAFGFMSTPGGSAADLRRTIFEAGEDFGMLLASVCSLWPKVGLCYLYLVLNIYTHILTIYIYIYVLVVV